METTNTFEPTPLKLVGIGGSTRAGSRNAGALRATMELARAAGAATEFIDLHAEAFPILDRDRDLAEYPPCVTRYLEAVRAADGFLLASPVYHGSMAGAFKNALDLLIYGDDAYFAGRPVGIIALGGANGAPVLEMMTTTVFALKGLVMPTRVLVGHGVVQDDGSIPDDQVTGRLDRLVTEVLEVATALRLRREQAGPATSAALVSVL
jgi:FMN reductase